MTPLTITITENAAKHVRDFTGRESEENVSLRESLETDKVIEEHGITILIDKKSYIFLAGTILDYSGGLNGKGFVFSNPNAKTTCGCGTSFSV